MAYGSEYGGGGWSGLADVLAQRANAANTKKDYASSPSRDMFPGAYNPFARRQRPAIGRFPTQRPDRGPGVPIQRPVPAPPAGIIPGLDRTPAPAGSRIEDMVRSRGGIFDRWGGSGDNDNGMQIASMLPGIGRGDSIGSQIADIARSRGEMGGAGDNGAQIVALLRSLMGR
jgi:hypothetical protein